MTFHEKLQLVAGGVLWAVVVFRWRSLLRPGSARVLEAALGCLAAAEVLQIPSVYATVNRLLGNLAAGSMLKVAFALGAAAGVRTLALGVSGGASSARRDWVLAGAAAVLSSAPLIVWPPTSLNPALAGTTEYLDTGWRSLAHWVPFLAYLAWALGSGALLCWRFGRRAPAGPLRTGLTLIGCGCSVGGLYLVLKVAVLVAWHTGGSLVTWERVDTSGEAIVLAVCLVLIALGSGWDSLTGLGATATAVGRLRRLGPLWRAVVDLDPGLALRDRQRGVRYRLRRRVVEIRDGLLVLEERVDDADVQAARQAVAASGVGDSEQFDAALVATLLRWALAAGPGRPSRGRVPLPLGQGDSFESEVRWLTLVARHLGSSTARTPAPGVAEQVRSA